MGARVIHVGSQTSQLEALRSRRLGALITPREHGAWGLLLVPLMTGGAVGLFAGGNARPLMAFTVTALALFWLRTPVESWLGTGLLRAQTGQERRRVGVAILVLAAAGASALALLFWQSPRRELLMLGMVAISAFVAERFLRRVGRRARIFAQVLGTLGLTVTAPAAYLVVTGRLDRAAAALWAANFLFAGNQIQFVHLRLHSARIRDRAEKIVRGRGFLAGEAALATALLFAWHFNLLYGLAALSFLPLLLRGAIWFFQRQNTLVVRRLGWTELAHSLVFGVGLVAGFQFGG